MRKRFIVLACIVGLFAGCQAVFLIQMRSAPRPVFQVTDSSGIRASFAHRVRAHLLAGHFDQLERMADSLRTTQERWPDGDWKLRTFYYTSFCKLDGASEAVWARHVARLREWCDAYPASITAPVALAYGLIGYAWVARGDGYAVTVSKDGWDLYRRRLGQAYATLDDARKLPARCPGWYHAMQIVALGVGWEQDRYDAMLREALSQHPDYAGYYETAAHRLETKWYGEKGDWERFAETSTDTLPEPLRDEMYARIVWSQAKNYFNVFKQSAASWPRTKRGLLRLAEDHPNSTEIATARLWLATLADDEAQMRDAVARLGNRLDLGVTDNVFLLRNTMIRFMPKT